ncbi:MAG: bifunctional (p)ppGpp synthetase/guanosine-3',5'-bis(diphosphate) 3'-pyrophosphohydrolase, partial [Myxococcales bacterium]|nr:bifunctional (p)ppGpp synthetase/guanosine-3',5'-bis(diphosphate) 3'-pyrophosphohydrolase [Myxococcales bacterium]
ADRLHNMRTLVHMPEDKQKAISKETLDIFAPLANRLGINWVKTELEDLCFKYLFPVEYKRLAESIQKTRAEREQYIERVISLLKRELGGHGLDAEVTGRPKHLWSIRQKIHSSGRDLGSLFDILAFRISVDKTSECYEALGLVHSIWRPVPGRFKDYVALPKGNGYQSLHTAVMGPEGERVEIQIRTREMHRIAELGVAAHWSYKEGKYGLGTQDTDERFRWLRQLLEWQRDLKDPSEFMETVKVDLFDDEVFVFTPTSEVQFFPVGSTPLDFAYRIHTTLGHECTGAIINGTIQPLKYALQNGDVVEILRTAGSKPKPDWIKVVRTGRAATKIRHFLRQEANARAEQIGIELLERELRRYGVSLTRTRRGGKLEEVAGQLRQRSEKELLMDLGYAKIRPNQVLPLIVPADKLSAGPKPEKEENPLQRLVKKVIPTKGGLIVDGIDGVATHFPKCCSPVNGDAIVGFVTVGRGVSVHRKDCPRTLDYDPDRRVGVRWDTESRQVTPVQIRVHSTDAPGLLASMSQSFHSAGVNITAVDCKTTPDKRAINNFTVMVSDVEQLRRVMGQIERIEGVTSVERLAS